MQAEQVRKLWKLFLANYLGTDDPAAIGLFEKKVSVVGLMKMASTVAFSTNARAVMEGVLAIVRTNLLANAEQLKLYFSIGGYVSDNTRHGKWGTGAIESISNALQTERRLPVS